MITSMLDVLRASEDRQPERFPGVVVAIVTNNHDPDDRGRVKVKFPWLSDTEESWWARIATPMAGNGRGAYFLPEVDDEVLVAFEHGDIQFPYIVGALWNGVDAPPTNNADGENNIRMIRSRSGHVIRLDDSAGAEKVEVIDKTGSNKIIIDSSERSITIHCDGKLTIEATGIEIKSNTDITIRASTTIDAQATAPMTLKGAVVNIN